MSREAILTYSTLKKQKSERLVAISKSLLGNIATVSTSVTIFRLASKVPTSRTWLDGVKLLAEGFGFVGAISGAISGFNDVAELADILKGGKDWMRPTDYEKIREVLDAIGSPLLSLADYIIDNIDLNSKPFARISVKIADYAAARRERISNKNPKLSNALIVTEALKIFDLHKYISDQIRILKEEKATRSDVEETYDQDGSYDRWRLEKYFNNEKNYQFPQGIDYSDPTNPYVA